MKKLACFLALVMLMTTVLVSCGGDKVYPVEFTVSDATASAGETVSVEISIVSTTDANAFMLYDLAYDKDVLEFVGFANLGDAGEKSFFGEAGFDQKLGTVSIALMEAEKLTGKVCEITFKVKDGAKAGEVKVSMKSIVKNSTTEIDSNVADGTVTVK